MIKFKSVFIFSFLTMLAQAQTWSKGDIFAGVSSQLTGVSVLDAQLTPQFGYAVSDADMFFAGMKYTQIDDATVHQWYSLGYQRNCWASFVGGVSYSWAKDSGFSYSNLTGHFGLYRNIGKWLYVQPQISVDFLFGDAESTNLGSEIKFGLRFAQ